MGWILEPVSDGPIIRLYVTNKELVIGRKDCDFVVDNNQAVSRKHAGLYVSHPAENVKHPHKIPILTIKDLGSKYGTYVNGELVNDGGVILKEEDVVMLGEHSSRNRAGVDFRVAYEPLIVSTSCLDPSAKIELMTYIREIGGHVISDWRPSCTHLVMNEVKVTIKAACAMTSLKPLVTVRYFADYLVKLKMNEPVPDFRNYVPKSGEEALGDSNITFDIVSDRANVFGNKTFLFLSEDQYAKMSPLLSSGGARATLINKNSIDPYANQMLSPGVCVIKCPNPELERSYRRVEEILKEQDRRLIPESDIGLAVVNCSTQFYCNPDFKGDMNSLRIQSQSLNQSVSLPLESKESLQRSIIPETLQSNQSSVVPPSTSIKMEESKSNVKRSREENDYFDQPASKSSRTEINPLPEVEPQVPDFPIRIKPEPISQSRTMVRESEDQTQPIDLDIEDPTQPVSPNLFSQDSDNESDDGIPSFKKQRTDQRESDSDQNDELSSTNKRNDRNEDDENRPNAKKPRLNDDEMLENLEPIVVPFGFMNAKQKRRENNQNAYDDENDGNVANVEPIRPNLLGTKMVSLVKRQPGYSKDNDDTDNVIPPTTVNNVKNYKRFKKSAYAGLNRLPRVIGSDDLRPCAHGKPRLNVKADMEEKDWMDDAIEEAEPELIKSQPVNPALLADSADWI